MQTFFIQVGSNTSNIDLIGQICVLSKLDWNLLALEAHAGEYH